MTDWMWNFTWMIVSEFWIYEYFSEKPSCFDSMTHEISEISEIKIWSFINYKIQCLEVKLGQFDWIKNYWISLNK